MEEDKFKKVMELLDTIAHKCHLMALKGIAPHETLRAVAEHLEIRFEEKDIARAEKDVDKFCSDLSKHLVKEAEDDEFKIMMKELEPAVKNLYHAVFNILVFERLEIMKLDQFVESSVKKLPPGEFRQEIGKAINEIVDEWQKNLRVMHNGANAVLAKAKDHKSFALALTNALHTNGVGYIKRRQEQNLVKDAHRSFKKAEKEAMDLLKRRVKDRKEADRKLARTKELTLSAIRDYSKAAKLLDLDWESGVEQFQKLHTAVNKGVAEHEIPERDAKQFAEINHKMLSAVLEPFLHSINEGVNQLDTIRANLASGAEKLKKAA